jgi:hypothetical protein
MHEGEVKTAYSFGDVIVKVSVDGNGDRPELVLDHMLSTAGAVTAIEIVQYGVTNNQRSEAKLKQKYTATAEFGEIKIGIEIVFDLNKSFSKRTLNSIVFSGILPKIWQSAGVFFGDGQTLTRPSAPLAQLPHYDVLRNIESVLLQTPEGAEANGHQTSEQRSRQLAAR